MEENVFSSCIKEHFYPTAIVSSTPKSRNIVLKNSLSPCEFLRPFGLFNELRLNQNEKFNTALVSTPKSALTISSPSSNSYRRTSTSLQSGRWTRSCLLKTSSMCTCPNCRTTCVVSEARKRRVRVDARLQVRAIPALLLTVITEPTTLYAECTFPTRNGSTSEHRSGKSSIHRCDEPYKNELQ